MGVAEVIAQALGGAGLTPACIIAIVAMYLFHLNGKSKDRIIERQGDTILKTVGQSTGVLTEMKTLLTALVTRGQ